jgi:hypothetical protein
MITREEIIQAMLEASRSEQTGGPHDAMTAAFNAVGSIAAIVPRKATHAMLLAAIKEDRSPIDAAIEEGDLTK